MTSRTKFCHTLRKVIFSVAVAALIGSSSVVLAAPLCSDMLFFPVALDDFDSCEASGQDSLPNVQAALDDALEPDVELLSDGSFCTQGTCENSEFSGTDPGNGFVIDPPNLNSTSFTFNQIPPGTQFITLKQGPGFQVFKVPGPTPFVLSHDLNGNDTSHISTFNAVPEPSTGTLMLLMGLVSVFLRRR